MQSEKSWLPTQTFIIFLFLVSVFLLALCKVGDTDAWMHLSFGRLIWELKGLPSNEPFVYTSLDKPFSYSSWLFGLIYYMAYHAFNIYGVILLKAITITTAFYILIKDSLRPYKNHIVSIMVMTAVVLMSRHRFVERPDTFLMVFLPFSIFSLNAFVYDNKKYIYALPFTHMLWANSHSSVILMFVPFLSFIVGGLLPRYLNRIVHSSPFTVYGKQSTMNGEQSTVIWELSASQLKTIALIFLASLAASLVSPYFVSQFGFGAQFLASDWFKQEIMELSPPTWENNKWPYIMTAVVIISFALNIKRFALSHFFLVMPFIVLSFTALRFVFLLGIVSGPVLARNLSAYLHDSELWNRISRKRIALFIPAVWVVLYAALGLTAVEPFAQKEKEFGFGVSYSTIPEGAMKYMDRRNITGRVFNLFQWGGYIVWRDFPKRSVFVDPRGYISIDLLEKMNLARANASVLDELYKTYGFESILAGYPSNVESYKDYPDYDLSLSHPGWALVYWDDASLLYLKRGSIYDAVIKQDEYRFVRPANSIEGAKAELYDKDIRDNIIAELRRNIAETGSSKAYTFIGFVYNEIRLYREAIDAFLRVRDLPIQSHIADAYNGIAYAYGGLGYIDEAIKYYKKAKSLTKDSATILYNIGSLYFKKGDMREATKYFEKALAINSNLLSIYPLLIDAYHELGMEDKVRGARQAYERAAIVKGGEEHFSAGVKAYLGKEYNASIEEFKKSIKANPTNPAPYSNLGYVYFDIGITDKAYEYQRKAIDIDPNFANAHYGLALVCKKKGDTDMAKKHWEEYLRIEPAGYYSRKAKEEIKALSSS